MSALCLTLLELSLRLIYATSEPAYAVSPGGGQNYSITNPEFVHSVRTNSINIRDSEIGEKRPAEHRILFAGDSFTFGLGVEIGDAFHSRLEQSLLHSGNPINALNFGGKGRVFRETGRVIDETEADALVAQIYIGNDFYDLQAEVKAAAAEDAQQESRISSAGEADAREQGGEEEPRTPIAPIDARAKYRDLYIIEIIWRNLVEIEAFDDLLFMTDLRYGGRPLLLRDQPDLEKRLVDRELEILAAMIESARSKGVELYVFLIPFKVQALKAHLLDPEKYDYQKPNRILKEFFAQRGVPCLDFLDLYDAMEHEEVRRLYYNRDLHWNAAGHAHAAQALAHFLSRADSEYSLRPSASP